jgi:hypothetical protein
VLRHVENNFKLFLPTSGSEFVEEAACGSCEVISTADCEPTDATETSLSKLSRNKAGVVLLLPCERLPLDHGKDSRTQLVGSSVQVRIPRVPPAGT